MDDTVSAKQIFERLCPYDLSRVRFQMPDGLPVLGVSIDTDTEGGAVVTVSDQDNKPEWPGGACRR